MNSKTGLDAAIQILVKKKKNLEINLHNFLGLERGSLYRVGNWRDVTEDEADQLIELGASGHCRTRGKIIAAMDIAHLLPPALLVPAGAGPGPG